MKTNIVLFLLFVTSLIELVSCGPRDTHIKNLKERLHSGEMIKFNNLGDRLPTCFKDENDWQDLRLHENDYEAFVLHQLFGIMQNGYKNCLRVGSRVFVSNNKIKASGSLGWAEITGVVLVSLDAIGKGKNKELLTKALGATYFDQRVESLAKSAQVKDQGIVQIIQFKYIPGSSSLEAQIKAKQLVKDTLESQLIEGKIFSEKEEGKFLPSCIDASQIWKEMRVNESEYTLLIQGKIKTIIKSGLKNCHQVGQEIPINSKGLSGQLGIVKITELKLLSLESLKKQQKVILDELTLANFNFSLERIEKELKNDTNKIVSLIYFDYLGVK
ncbi:MAG: hypothetical protein H6625_03600 [Bdellovibrionaceae bacterium]|nr:hypothetical protein [Pseudobdellovibrionaceae bacterium]